MAMKVSPQKSLYIADRAFLYGIPAFTVFSLGLGIYHLIYVPGDGMGTTGILCAMLGVAMRVLHKVMRGDYESRN